MTTLFSHILVIGGAGYVGSNLVPKLLDDGYQVTVFDLFIYGDDIFETYGNHSNLRRIKGDIRDIDAIKAAIVECDAIIHLACISNDPSFDLDPALGKTINFDSFAPLVDAAKESGIKRFIYASSSSVYGIKEDPLVTEDLKLEPLTDYSRYKVMCEEVLEEKRDDDFVCCIVRPATVCGYAPRQRLDVVVNILTNFGYHNGVIKVFGGDQKRPNIHIEDMADIYRNILRQPDDKVNGGVWNAGYENHTVMQLAQMVRNVIGDELEIIVEPTDDNRSYHVSSEKIQKELNFEPKYTIEDAISSLVEAFKSGKLKNTMDNPFYYNIKRMNELNLK